MAAKQGGRWVFKNPWGRIELEDRKYEGYFLDGRFQPGFADNPELSERERLTIAQWAKKLTPDALSPKQEQLLAENPPSVSRVQTESNANYAELEDPEIAALWDTLTDEERHLARRPGDSPHRPDARYPLTVGEIAAITGATERKIRSWADEGLLPAFRERNDRRFYSAAVILAFVLQRTPTHTKAVVAAAARGEAGQAFQLLAATLGRAAPHMPEESSKQFERLAKDLTAASRLMTDGGPRST